MAINKLSAHPYAQAYVNSGFGMYALISYETEVALIDVEGWLYIFGLYSSTTRRHIGAFVKEYANIDYRTAKMLYENREIYNIYTGEIKDWE